jgi:hypothetical protein
MGSPVTDESSSNINPPPLVGARVPASGISSNNLIDVAKPGRERRGHALPAALDAALRTVVSLP